ncbi:endothelin-converting enzyme 1 [Rhipicephalus microplus]|uniref:endothelin-converting enzyme 1 n=1 Tax=Rhipicephalus microplus TaxID=6941 RepID=UPI003F6AEECC
MTVLRLVPGSPAHRHYFETLYTHYGAGVTDGVTFEDMLGFEAEVLEPLLQMYSVARRAYVFERSPYDTSGTWERWTTTIARHYDLTGSEEITISTSHREYFLVALQLIAQKETVVELVIGWLCVQFTSWFANRQLIANYHGYGEHVAAQHQRACLSFTLATMGVALFVPFVASVYTEPVRADAARIARAVRRTVYQSLDRATYPWFEMDVVFSIMNIASAHDLEARFSRFPDMEVSFVRNVRDAANALRQTDADAIGTQIHTWMLRDQLYAFFAYPDRLDYTLKPSVLAPPVYHVSAPAPVRLGTFGVEVAKATIFSYVDLRHEGHSTDSLDIFRSCFYAAMYEDRPRETDAEWERRVGLHMASGAAIDVALAVLKTEASFDEQRLPGVPLSGRQLFYVMLCYMQCGAQHGAALCNEPLKHKEDFSDAFACPPRSKMRSRHQCKSFV